jgi:hypothetical protein
MRLNLSVTGYMRAQSGWGQPHSKTFGDGFMMARQRFGVRLSPAAFPEDSHI